MAEATISHCDGAHALVGKGERAGRRRRRRRLVPGDDVAVLVGAPVVPVVPVVVPVVEPVVPVVVPPEAVPPVPVPVTAVSCFAPAVPVLHWLVPCLSQAAGCGAIEGQLVLRRRVAGLERRIVAPAGVDALVAGARNALDLVGAGEHEVHRQRRVAEGVGLLLALTQHVTHERAQGVALVGAEDPGDLGGHDRVGVAGQRVGPLVRAVVHAVEDLGEVRSR